MYSGYERKSSSKPPALCLSLFNPLTFKSSDSCKCHGKCSPHSRWSFRMERRAFVVASRVSKTHGFILLHIYCKQLWQVSNFYPTRLLLSISACVLCGKSASWFLVERFPSFPPWCWMGMFAFFLSLLSLFAFLAFLLVSLRISVGVGWYARLLDATSLPIFSPLSTLVLHRGSAFCVWISVFCVLVSYIFQNSIL